MIDFDATLRSRYFLPLDYRRSPNASVHRATCDSEEFGEFSAGVFAVVVEGDEVYFLGGGELGLLPRSLPLALSICMPSRVWARMRSGSNSATMARTLNMLFKPTGDRSPEWMLQWYAPACPISNNICRKNLEYTQQLRQHKPTPPKGRRSQHCSPPPPKSHR